MTTVTNAVYRQLGSSGLRVSVPILGGMSIGSSKWLPWVLDEEKALPLLKAAWDRGVTTIDSANLYSNGESERLIGKFMSEYKIPREKLVIISKVLCLVHPDLSVKTMVMPELANTRDFVNQGGLSRTAIFNQVDASLKRLGTSYVDILQIHSLDGTTPYEETMRALHDLVVAGKVRYLGASNIRAWQLVELNRIAEKNGWTQFTSVEVEHSLLYRPEEKEMFEYCKYKGIGIVSYAPLLAGALARPLDKQKTQRSDSVAGTHFDKIRRDSDNEIIRRVEKLANEKSWTMAQVALAWSATKVASPIVGATSPDRLEGSMITGKTLSDDEIKFLEEPYEYQPTRW